MSKIKPILEELDKVLQPTDEARQIAEGGLARIYAHVNDDDKTFAMISAYRHENTKEENNRQTMLLTHDLVHMGLGSIKMEGGYVEVSDDGKEVPVTERSFFVPNITKEQAIELCAKYNQDSVLFKDKDGMRYITKEGKDDSEKFTDIVVDDNYQLNKIKDFFSRRLQGGNKRNFFKFKESFYVGIQNWKWGRSRVSEYDNVEKSYRYTNLNDLI